MTEAMERLKSALADRYAVQRELGSGGMATVYLAQDTKLERHVAVKVVKPELAAVLGKERFLREVKITAKLEHPHILGLYDSGEADGFLYYVMPFVEGESLRDRLDREKQLPVEDAVQIALEVADALSYAHSHDVLHRDIKPENILLESGHAVVADFGIARAISAAGGDRLTETGLAIGTPTYMSPEQAAGSGELDGRSDLYSLGCVLYEMLAGQPPFTGPTAQSILHQHLAADPPSLSQFRTDVDADVGSTLQRALQKDPADRYGDASAFGAELLRLGHPAATTADIRRLVRQPKIALPLAAVVVGMMLAATCYISRNSRIRWAESEALPELRSLVQAGEHFSAFWLAEEAEKYVPDSPMLSALWPRISTEYSIVTSPPGAELYFKEHAAVDEEWRYLGRSPLENLRFPIGVFRWQIRKQGFHTVETVRATPEAASRPVSTLEITLDELGSLPAGMLRMPAGTLRVRLGYLAGTDPIEAPAYFIDQYEVTNEQYEDFVDAGGYQDPTYWKHEIIIDGEEVSWNAAMTRFRDRTGRSGPSTWEGGRYPEGHEEYPVGGISWYEAAAFAEFAGKNLPTVHHWASAASLEEAQAIVTLSNYSGEPAPTGSNPGIGATGLYDMAGNVREWCWNTDESGDMRYILGGSWSDLSYLFLVADTRPPWDRAPDNGVRTVQYVGGRDAVPETAFLSLARSYFDYRNVTPITDAQYESYRTHLYAYDRTDLNAVVEEVDETSALWRKEKITFDAAYSNERVTAYLFIPKGIDPPYQSVIYFPTGVALRPHESENIDRQQGFHSYFWEFVVMSGRALMYPVYKGTYERQLPGGRPSASREPIGYRDWYIQLSKDYRRSIDYLDTRSDILHEKLAYYGVSWGANVGPVMVAIDDRVKTAIFLLGGFLGRHLPEVDPVNFAPHISVPTLMINGEHDYAFPIETSQLPMFELLGTPPEHKVHSVYPGGHGMWGHFGHQARGEILEWLDRYLGPVN